MIYAAQQIVDLLNMDIKSSGEIYCASLISMPIVRKQHPTNYKLCLRYFFRPIFLMRQNE